MPTQTTDITKEEFHEMWNGCSGGFDYYYQYDANGNVRELTDAVGTIVYRYEYTPFGKLVSDGGDTGVVNPFRFSTKYYDGSTGLSYYGYRYYDSELGRWLNRDPIEEDGGINLYGMVWNNPLKFFDILGREPKTTFDGDWGNSPPGNPWGVPNQTWTKPNFIFTKNHLAISRSRNVVTEYVSDDWGDTKWEVSPFDNVYKWDIGGKICFQYSFKRQYGKVKQRVVAQTQTRYFSKRTAARVYDAADELATTVAIAISFGTGSSAYSILKGTVGALFTSATTSTLLSGYFKKVGGAAPYSIWQSEGPAILSKGSAYEIYTGEWRLLNNKKLPAGFPKIVDDFFCECKKKK